MKLLKMTAVKFRGVLVIMLIIHIALISGLIRKKLNVHCVKMSGQLSKLQNNDHKIYKHHIKRSLCQCTVATYPFFLLFLVVFFAFSANFFSAVIL